MLALPVSLLIPTASVNADLRLPSPPGWYDPDGVGAGQDWHYRVPVSIPAGTAANATVKVDVDFTALLAQMGVSGTFDSNSPRIVRSTGALATTQEFTDRIYAGATDAAGNGRGEVRFLFEDSGATTYYIYFDVTQNGAKAANPQTAINGNFERGSTGTAQPPGWSAPTKSNAGFNAEIRPSETVSVTANPSPSSDGVNTRSTDGTPKTGDFSYLLGWRSSTAVDPDSSPGVTFTRTIQVPASNPGNLVFRYRVEGWDSYDGSSSYDFLRADIVGSTTVEMVGPTAGNYNTKPFSPNLGANPATSTVSGYGQYNGFDCDLSGTHRSGGTIACHSEPWITVTQSLAAFAGQTVTLRFRAFTTTQYPSWYHIDDVEWSVVTGTLGPAEAFGVVTTSPANAATLVPGQKLSITAQVNARPTAATNPVTANIYDSSGVAVATGIILYNDGTHGDVTAGDAIWTNDGLTAANPTYTIPLAATTGGGWTIRIFARDATASSFGAAGLAHRSGLPSTQVEANFWNVDDSVFAVGRSDLTITKSSSVFSDPANGSTNPKAIPGAVMLYCVTVTNPGSLVASTVVATDTLPASVVFVPGSMRSGASCASATTVEDDDNSGADESDPIGASASGATLTIVRPSLPAGTSFAVTYQAVIQ
jgi:uncharacterized repeat protein (TIGR01451 family)